jgi:enoyl-CoA hydratase/carnithine racemase
VEDVTSGQVTLSVEDGVAVVQLTRPERLNAFTPVMGRELAAAFDRTDEDDAVRVVIVTGAGRGFCAGADLSNQPSTPEVPGTDDDLIGGRPRDGGGVVALRIARSLKPVIAAVNGPAVGVGVTMTLPMDIRIASETARFALPFARRGIVPEATSSWFLPRVVGMSQALEWALTGRIFDAAEALRGGLVSRVVAPEHLLSVAGGLAREIVENTSAVSVAATRRMLWSMLSEPSPWTAHYVETHVIAEMKQTGDPAEGAASFLEKRTPRFPSRVSDGLPATAPNWPRRPPDPATPPSQQKPTS